MGSTGANGKRYKYDADKSSFGIRDARQVHDEKIDGAGFSKHDKNDIIMSVKSPEGKDIVFQFKLGRDNMMKIKAYDPNTKEKSKTEVNADRPSLDTVINNSKSTVSEKRDAQKIRDMMQRAKSDIKESSLGRIAHELKKRKNKKK